MSSTPFNANFALVDVNNFYVSCERLFRPDLKTKPVIVLSNNDGCVIARSNEAKQLGITMAQPYFQIKALCKQHRVTVFSSNYPLYADLSNRIMTIIEAYCPSAEIYSIDEAFLDLRGFNYFNANKFCHTLRQKIMKEIGIPVSIGIGPNKTIAKLATTLAKKTHHGVFDMSCRSLLEEYLKSLPTQAIWGIGQNWSNTLSGYNINTALDLLKADNRWLKQTFNVMVARTALELTGTICVRQQATDAKKSIICSRSFGQPQTSLNALKQALRSYCNRASQKLRKQHSVTGHLQVFVRTNHSPAGNHLGANSAGIKLITPTQDTRVITNYALKCLTKLYKDGQCYQKIGVCLSEMSSQELQQHDLFVDRPLTEESDKLMAVMDTINARYQQDKITLAFHGDNPAWQATSNHASLRYTTNWNELPVAR